MTNVWWSTSHAADSTSASSFASASSSQSEIVFFLSAIVFASSTILFSFSALFATSSNPRSTSRLLNAALPECFPSTIFALGSPSIPTLSGVMISYVSACFKTPCWWIPDSWAKALAPTYALFACTAIPVYDETCGAAGRAGMRAQPSENCAFRNCAQIIARKLRHNCAPASTPS